MRGTSNTTVRILRPAVSVSGTFLGWHVWYLPLYLLGIYSVPSTPEYFFWGRAHTCTRVVGCNQLGVITVIIFAFRGHDFAKKDNKKLCKPFMTFIRMVYTLSLSSQTSTYQIHVVTLPRIRYMSFFDLTHAIYLVRTCFPTDWNYGRTSIIDQLIVRREEYGHRSNHNGCAVGPC